MEILIVAILLGLIPALIAKNKGRSFIEWWVYGALLFIIAIVHVFIIKPNAEEVEKREISDNGMKKCPFCAELIKGDAIKCKHCGSDVTYIKAIKDFLDRHSGTKSFTWIPPLEPKGLFRCETYKSIALGGDRYSLSATF